MTRRFGGHFANDLGSIGDCGISSLSFITAPAKIAQHHGASCFQMFIGPSKGYEPFRLGQSSIDDFKSARGEGTVVTAHGPYLPNVCSNERWRESVVSIVKYMHVADSLGVEYMVFHPGSHKGEGADYGKELLVKATQFIIEQTKSLRTKLLWENTAGGGTQVGHVDVIADVVRLVGPEEVGLCIDTTHSFADGHNLVDKVYRAEFWEKYSNITDWVHFNNPDRNVTLGGHLDRHRQNWLEARWPVDVMLEIADSWGSSVPLCMEADPSAYEVNFMLLGEAGFV